MNANREYQNESAHSSQESELKEVEAEYREILGTLTEDERESVESALKEEAIRAGISLPELLRRRAGTVPRYFKAAEAMGRLVGKTGQQVLDEQLKEIEESNYPSEDCLEPREAERSRIGWHLFC